MQVTSIAHYQKVLKEDIAKSGASEVFVIGHSHGGWLSMQQILRGDFGDKKVNLFTIDPISFEKV